MNYTGGAFINDFRTLTSLNYLRLSEPYLFRDLDGDIAYSPRITGSGRLEVNLWNCFAVRLTGKYAVNSNFDNTMSEERTINPYF